MKKSILFILILCVVLVMTACDIWDFSNYPVDLNPEPEAVEVKRKESLNDGKIELVIAGVSSQSVKDAIELFGEKVSEYSDGKIVVQHFPDNILGNDVKQWEMAKSGDCDIAIGKTSSVASLYEDFYIYDIPYLFTSRTEALNIGLSGKTTGKIKSDLEEHGLKVLTMWDNGYECIATNDKLIETTEDIKGLKICTKENEVHTEILKLLGAEAKITETKKFISAVRQNEADGIEGTYSDFVSEDIQAIEKYCFISEHIYSPLYVVINLDVWNSLEENMQDALTKAISESTELQLSQEKVYEAQMMEDMESAGCKLLTADEKTKSEIMTYCQEAAISIATDKMEHPEYIDEMNIELSDNRE